MERTVKKMYGYHLQHPYIVHGLMIQSDQIKDDIFGDLIFPRLR